MKLYNYRWIPLALLFLLIVAGCSNQKGAPPKAENGVINLTGWSFDNQGNIKLDGEWEFY